MDAKRFDLLCLRIQLAMLRGAGFAPLRKAFVAQVHQLEAKGAMPDVARQMALVLEVQTDEWWTDGTPEMVEIARRRLRGLMSLIEPGKQVIVTTDLADAMGSKREIKLMDLGGASSLAQFRCKARAFVDAHADNMPSFIRSLVGLDRRAAQTAFNDALAGTVLSASRIDFVERIVDYLTGSGSMDPAALYEPPFTDAAPNGVSDMFDGTLVTRIVETLNGFEPRLERAM